MQCKICRHYPLVLLTWKRATQRAITSAKVLAKRIFGLTTGKTPPFQTGHHLQLLLRFFHRKSTCLTLMNGHLTLTNRVKLWHTERRPTKNLHYDNTMCDGYILSAKTCSNNNVCTKAWLSWKKVFSRIYRKWTLGATFALETNVNEIGAWVVASYNTAMAGTFVSVYNPVHYNLNRSDLASTTIDNMSPTSIGTEFPRYPRSIYISRTITATSTPPWQGISVLLSQRR